MGLLGAPRMQAFPLSCPRCGEPIRIIAFVTEGDPISVPSNLSVTLQAPPIASPGSTPLGGGRRSARSR